jgi:hypothetical protein
MAALEQDLAPVPVPQPRRRPAPPTPIAVAVPRRRPARYLMFMVLVASAGVFGCVTLNALAAEQSFAVRELETDVTELTRSVDELTVEVTRLESPDRLHRVATTRLGMVPAEQPAFLVMPRAGSDESADSSRTMAAPAPPSDG